MNPPPPRAIRRILVANRGEIARRIFRTAHDLGIECVAVHSTVDSGAPYVGEADLAVHLPGSSSTETYLDGSAIIQAARRSGSDALHPGYGFLSENPDFAEQVVEAGITWIGPSPSSIRAMALKVQAKAAAARAGVPLAPGAELPADLDAPSLERACAQVGYPLLIKASAGGGGRGMRVVPEASDLVAAVESARREAASAFGDATVFAERYLAGARHVEVQVFGDMLGNVVHCFERECSIQRRHQKVIEEAPAPGITESTRRGLCDAATALARSIGYVGAGTVEFLVLGSGVDQQYCFLEMNTRLQVEHPVTEAITGIDLVAWQIAVAQGERLPRDQAQITVQGHAIEARIYAEDPARGYLPGVGRIESFGGMPDGLRVDSGVEAGSVVTTHYDPMLAKVIAHASTRALATRRLALGLRRLRIHGPVSNRDSLVAVLEHPVFTAGEATTSFLDDHPQVLDPTPDSATLDRHVLAATFAWADALTASGDETAIDVPAGWRNVPAVPQAFSWQRRGDSSSTTVRYRRTRSGLVVDVLQTDQTPRSALFTEEGRSLEEVSVAVAHRQADGRNCMATVEVAIDGLRARHEVRWTGEESATVYVDDVLASSAWVQIPRFAQGAVGAGESQPVTAVPGRITAVEVSEGDMVEAGQTLVVLEAMKMEHRIRALGPGRVARVLVAVGDAVEAHAVVVELESAEVERADHG